MRLRLDERDWRERAQRHRARVEPYVTGRVRRRQRGEKHPVDDFLFEYYGYSPARLMRWHPGAGVVLGGDASEYAQLGTYRTYDDGVGADLGRIAGRRDGFEWTRGLLALTASRPGRTDCFGLHEWAMVYRQAPDEVRHASWPLRLGTAGTDAVVEAHQLRCTHVDAYRFFTPEAAPRNASSPSRETQRAMEQPGCLHANMDLYKWAMKLVPYGDSDLLVDCFALARDVRELDMRAAPYDLSALGCTPVPIETPEGKAEYVRLQRAHAERAAGLRARLLADYDRALAAGAQTR
ncbi:3-methyladenine DNA glycosylase [Mumia sp. zg.B53]|uniref:3-methyladenine DNA glycosylase n=1 Tax=unclassified Mumia TaxID=2621872 RepID=UPI001C6E8E58|nr:MULTISPECIES: 3-methyladenine DNA glycosylase [unclassified Mumia]MBW9208375.1 3-methyladenine DNA glycosylase [Mumia sp. zg.B21]MBW9216333.1 3-methyladenine DNA glycosylase [Mumia sp. zg.B53]MDD9347981.1 3-methyladenine DNA glycosylase [Mumia sp.]